MHGRKCVLFSCVLVGCIVLGTVLFPDSTLAAVYSFSQTSWSGGATANTTAHTLNQTGWAEYGAKDAALSIVNGGADLQLGVTSQALVQTSDANAATGFNLTGSAHTQTEVTGSGSSASIILNTVADAATTTVAAGNAHSCALRADGTVFCWGQNYYGQLGINSTTDSYLAAQVHGVGGTGFLSDVVQIGAGGDFTCALKADGTVYCWGRNGTGYNSVGDGTGTQRTVPVQVHGVGDVGYLTDVASISIGYMHSCAVKTDGTAYCWGAGAFGQLGNGGTSTTKSTPVQVVDVGGSGTFTDVAQIFAGAESTCAIKTDGTAYCWGVNTNGKLGDGSTTQRTSPVQVHGVGDVGYLTGVTHMAMAVDTGDHTCAVVSSGAAYCWGTGTNGQRGDASTVALASTPVQVLGVDGVGVLEGVARVTAGKEHTCAVKTDGTAYCWGKNTYGYLGDNSQTQRTTPVQVVGVGASGYLTSVMDVRAGSGHSCAVKTDGTAYCWGYSSYGAIGDGSTDYRLAPVVTFDALQPIDIFGVSEIDGGGDMSCALKTDGVVFCWGEGSFGALGDNAATQRDVPVQVHGVADSGYLSGVSAISVGDQHVCALKTDGTVFCWGDNTNGQLGDNTTTQRNVPVQVHGVADSGYLSGVSSISAGHRHTCAVKTDGTVFCWGIAGNGELGNASIVTPQKTPVQVVDVGGSGTLTGVSSVSAGYRSTCAVKTDGTAYCWGANTNGKLGDGSTTQRTSPVQVHGVGDVGYLTGVSQIELALGQGGHTCAVKTDGTVFCWGLGSNGQRGDASTVATASTPVQVLGVGGTGVLEGAASVQLGYTFACASMDAGTVYCWGYNLVSQLGDNSNTQRTSPVQVVGVGASGYLASIARVATGYQHTCARTETGAVLCWGAGTSGQRGDATEVTSDTPVAVKNILSAGMDLSGSTDYVYTGTYTSGSIDTAGSIVLADTTSWTTSGTGYVYVKARTDADGDFSNATDWSSCAYMVSGSAFSSGACATAGHRYVQYQATMYASGGASPTLDSVSITYSAYASSATLTSSPYDTETSAVQMYSLGWSEDASLPANTSVTVSMRTAATADGLSAAAWSDFVNNTPNCSVTTGTATCVSAALASAHTDGSGDQWVQYKVTLATTDSLSTPTVGEVVVGYSISSNAAPSVPSSLGAAAKVNGSTSAETQPSLTFELADTDTPDTLKYQIQVDDTADFSSPVIDYTAALGAQGPRTFVVGQAAGSGAYAAGTEGQTLSSGTSYYWRVKAIDNSAAESAYVVANSGEVAFIVLVVSNTTPTSPASIGPAAISNGSSSTVTRPSFTFTLADADVGDTVKYQIQIDNTANFSSAVVDYTSALAAQGERTFTVGQDAGSGTYTEGSAGQSLTSGASYYWRVRTVDENDATGSWVTANDGEAAFVITAEAAAEEVVETTRSSVSTLMPIVWINGTDTRATSTNVTLTLRGIPRTTLMILSNRLDFVGAQWEPFAVTKRWNLCQVAGALCSPGVYTVYVTYFSAPDAFPATATVSDSIHYEQGVAALFEKNLTLGHISEDVRRLQKALNSSPGTQIALTGPGSPGKETNVFGALTKAAVIKYQKANTIAPAIGYFGPLTRAKMNATR